MHAVLFYWLPYRPNGTREHSAKPENACRIIFHKYSFYQFDFIRGDLFLTPLLDSVAAALGARAFQDKLLFGFQFQYFVG
jgi:hypothetical protein